MAEYNKIALDVHVANLDTDTAALPCVVKLLDWVVRVRVERLKVQKVVPTRVVFGVDGSEPTRGVADVSDRIEHLRTAVGNDEHV